MSAIVWTEKGTSICVEHFPDRKRPALCIVKESFVTVYGYFKDDASAALFMKELVELVGAKQAYKEGEE